MLGTRCDGRCSINGMTRAALPDTLIFDPRRDSVGGWRSLRSRGWQVEDPVRTSAEVLFQASPSGAHSLGEKWTGSDRSTSSSK